MLKLVSLNIEGDNHLARFIPFLQKESPDVICLQELLEKDIPLIEKETGTTCVFAPMFYTDWEKGGPFPVWRSYYPEGTKLGSGIFFRTKPTNVETYNYNTISTIPKRAQEVTVHREVIVATIQLYTSYTIASTHFTWTGDGSVSDEQREDATKLLVYLERFPDMILCGDFNIPRPNEVYQMFTQRFTDNIPPTATTTLDQHLHKIKNLQLVVDYVFTSPHYRVSDLRLVDGVSDHIAIVSTVMKV